MIKKEAHNFMNKRSHCPVNYLLELLGDKWSFLIIRDMLFFQKKTYKEFLAGNEKISTNILADKLLKLEEAGIIEKHPSGNKSKYYYILTQKGFDLWPVLFDIIEWGSNYEKESRVPGNGLNKIINEREKFMLELKVKFEEIRKNI